VTLNLKRADESEQEAINTLIIKSEMASMGNAGNPSAFVRQYSISQRALLFFTKAKIWSAFLCSPVMALNTN